MPKYRYLTSLNLVADLGPFADLTIDNICYDVSNMSMREMLSIYEPMINTAEVVTLMSDGIGRWGYNRHRREWERA